MKLSIGTAQFGSNYGISNKTGKIGAIEGKKIIDFAESAGINSIDTAVSYGDSEKSLGDIGISKFDVVTKIPSCKAKKNEIFNWVLNEVDNSILRLKQDKIFGLLVHDTHDLVSDNGHEIFNAMSYLKKTNKVSKIGISAYSPTQILEVTDRYNIDLVQAPLNILDRRLVESGCLASLKNKNIEVHTRSCFLQGLLLSDLSEIPFQFTKWKELFYSWHNWLKANNKNALQTCLSYPLSIKGIDRVIVGIDSLKQLKEIFSSRIYNEAFDFPDIHSSDENLINPMNWKNE